MEKAERVAFCGLGTMGWPMAANLARAGFDLSALLGGAMGYGSPATVSGGLAVDRYA